MPVFMRILSYNILDGGIGRADPIAEVIAAQNADLVALIEADDPDVVDRVAGRLSMEYLVGRGRRHSVAMLSRWPIVQSLNHGAIRGRPDCLLEATVRSPESVEWIVGVLHLHARAFEADEVEREAELDEVLEVFAEYRRAGRAHLLAGDFNANSPIQQIDPAKVKPTTREAWRANGGQIPRRVVQRLLDAGYVDLLALAHPTSAGTMTTFTTQHPGQRVDYVFGYGLANQAVRQAWIERDRLARFASDHYPVGVELA